MNITRAVVQLRERLIKAINEAGLPPVVVGFVLDGIQNEVTRLTAEDLKREDENGTAEHNDAE